MLRSTCLVVTTLVVFACAKEKAKDQAAPPPSSPPAVADALPAEGSGSAADGSGSAADGSGAAAGSVAEGSAASAEGSAAVAAGFQFDKLTHDEKVTFMKQKVMPTMKPLFQKFDGKEFAKFTCKTCHGDEPAKRKYEMPSPDLPALDFDAIEAGDEDPKIVEFMSKVVKPRMAKLLNEPEMSDTQPKGFGCLHCHTLKKKK